jgi:hypothetical protein
MWEQQELAKDCFDKLELLLEVFVLFFKIDEPFGLLFKEPFKEVTECED